MLNGHKMAKQSKKGKEMVDYIYQIQKNESFSMYYSHISDKDYLDENGFPRVKNDDNKVLAKAVPNQFKKHIANNNQTSYKYYVLFQTNNMYGYEVKFKTNQHIDRICKTDTHFKEVNVHIFKKYLEYLKTQNTQWLKEAQRDYND